MAYSLDRGRRSPYREGRSTLHRGRPPMPGPGQPGFNVVGHGRQPMMPGGNPYLQQPRPGMVTNSNTMMTSQNMMPMTQTGNFNPQMMPTQVPPQGYYMPPNQPMAMYQQSPYPQPVPYGQQNMAMQMNPMPMQMQPQNMTEEQKKEFEKMKKERYFQEQKQKLKAFSHSDGSNSWMPTPSRDVSSLQNMVDMLGTGGHKSKKHTAVVGDAMNGTKMAQSKQVNPITPSVPVTLNTDQPIKPTVSAMPAADDDGFGDFMSGPTPTAVTKTDPASVVSMTTPVTPPQSSQPTVPVVKEEKKDLESLMLQFTDLSAAQKPKKSFQTKTTLKDVQSQSKALTTSFEESAKAYKWNNTEELSTMFTMATPVAADTPQHINSGVPQSEGPSVQPATSASQQTHMTAQTSTASLPTSEGPNLQPGTATTGQNQAIPPTSQMLPSANKSPPAGTAPPWCKNEATLPLIYRHVLEATLKHGVIDTEKLHSILVLSGLDRQVLGHIWNLCNKTTPGLLTKEELFMALALIAIAQSGQLQKVKVETLFDINNAPTPVLTPPGGSTPSTPGSIQSSGTVTPATSVTSTPVEASSTADDDFAPFQEAQATIKGSGDSHTTTQPGLTRSMAQPSLPSSSKSSTSTSGFILLPPPPPPPPSYSQSSVVQSAADDDMEEINTPSPTHSLDSVGSSSAVDILDKFSAFHTGSDDTMSNCSIPSGSMYPPMSSEDEYADFKSVDSSCSSSMSSSRASSQTSSSQNTDPEFPGFPRVGHHHDDTYPDIPTSGSSSPSSIRYPERLTSKAVKSSTEPSSFDLWKSKSQSTVKETSRIKPLRAKSGNLNPSKFGPVRDSEDDDFAEFQQAASSSSSSGFSGFQQVGKIAGPPSSRSTVLLKSSNTTASIGNKSEQATLPKMSTTVDEFADFQQAPAPKEKSDDLFKFDDDNDDDKYAALRGLSFDIASPQEKETGDTADEFADFKDAEEADEFADFQKAGNAEFSGFQQDTSKSANEFADFEAFQQPSAIDKNTKSSLDDEFSDFQQSGPSFSSEDNTASDADFKGGMTGGFFQPPSAVDTIAETGTSVFSETGTSVFSETRTSVFPQTGTSVFPQTGTSQPVILPTTKETKPAEKSRKAKNQKLSSYDDDDDLFGRKPPELTDVGHDDDEFGDFGKAPPVWDDDEDELFSSVVQKPTKTKKPHKKMTIFGGQEFVGKVETKQDQQSDSSKQTFGNVSSDVFGDFQEETVSGVTTDDQFGDFKTSENTESTLKESKEQNVKETDSNSVETKQFSDSLTDDKYSVFRELSQSTQNSDQISEKSIDTKEKQSLNMNSALSENTTLQNKDTSLTWNKYQMNDDDDDDLFGNLGPNPPGYSPPVYKFQESSSDNLTASKTPDSLSINSKESDTSSLDNMNMKKGLPKLDSVASLDLRSYNTTPSMEDADSLGEFNTETSVTTSTGDDHPPTFTIGSQPAKPLDSRSGAMIISTGPPPMAALNSGSSLPWLGDRYGSVVGDIEDNERHTYEWHRCLQSCYHTIQTANEVFNGISSSSVCVEVIKSEEGSNYLQAVVEIYRVACRIGTAMKSSGFENDDLHKLIKDIDLLWNNVAAFLAGSSLMPDDSLFVFSSAVLKADPSNSARACGVCLLSVDSRSKAFDRLEDNHKLTYGGHQYHSTCANLWVNLVDSILPALPLPSLL
ncbi:uncharacterized protein LOC144449256 [Glandiceps talaboti]